ncbi:MAG: hypothetical protein ACE5HD_10780 [Acidobacteriota bacterium]
MTSLTQASERLLPWQRWLATAGLALAGAGLLVSTARAADESTERREMRIVVASGADAATTGLESVDIGDLEIGETRFLTTDSGKEIAVTREEDGLFLEIDGKEMHIQMDDEPGTRLFVGGADTAEADGDQVIGLSARSICIGRPGADEDVVTLSGLGDLDDARKDEIIDALRSAGIEKEIRFASPGHGFQFVTVNTDGDAEGEKNVNVEVRRCVWSGDGPHVVVVRERKEVEER